MTVVVRLITSTAVIARDRTYRLRPSYCAPSDSSYQVSTCTLQMGGSLMSHNVSFCIEPAQSGLAAAKARLNQGLLEPPPGLQAHPRQHRQIRDARIQEQGARRRDQLEPAWSHSPVGQRLTRTQPVPRHPRSPGKPGHRAGHPGPPASSCQKSNGWNGRNRPSETEEPTRRLALDGAHQGVRPSALIRPSRPHRRRQRARGDRPAQQRPSARCRPRGNPSSRCGCSRPDGFGNAGPIP